MGGRQECLPKTKNPKMSTGRQECLPPGLRTEPVPLPSENCAALRPVGSLSAQGVDGRERRERA